MWDISQSEMELQPALLDAVSRRKERVPVTVLASPGQMSVVVVSPLALA